MKYLAALVLLPLLSACRPVGPDYAPPKVRVPDRYAVPTGQASPGPRWWTSFQDPVLDALLEAAHQGSPDLQAAAARLRQARALQGVQDAQGGPDLNLDAKVTRDRLSPNGEMFSNLPFPNPQVNFTNWQAGFDASWELDFFGRLRRVSEGAQARTQAAAERLGDARVMVEADVARAYIDLRLWQARIKLADATLADLDDQVRLAGLSERAGEISALDAQQVRLGRSTFAAAAAGYRTGLRQDLTALAVLTGLDTQDLEARLGPGGTLPAVPPVPAGGVPSDLLRNRPDLRAAERDLAAATADVGVAVAERYPRFALVGTGGWNSVHSGTLLENASRTWSLGPQLSLPLFNRGLLKNQERAQRAASDAALAAYHKAVLSALADADVAFTRMARSEESRLGQEDALDRQRSVQALTEKQFQAGEVSKLASLQARRASLAQEDQALQARAQSLTAWVSVCKAMGGRWSDDPAK